MKNMREFVRRVFEDPKSKYFILVNDLLAFFTILSIAALVLDTVPALQRYHGTFLTIEYISVAFFSAEYILRLWSTKRKVSYLFSFFGLIDLISIIPTYVGLGNFTVLKSARVLRILRFLRILRIIKIARLGKNEDTKIFDIKVYFFALFSATLLFGSLMYLAEGFRPEFVDIPNSMIWAAKVILGGVPQFTPQTYFGEFIVIGARFTGLLLLGLLINIMAGGVRWLIFGEKLNEQGSRK